MHPQRQAEFRHAQRPPPPAIAALQSSIVQLFGRDVLPLLARPRADGYATQVASLARVAANSDAIGLGSALDDLLDQGLHAEHICQTYLTDVARKLGEMWADDRCTFIEVTLGAILLQNELRRMAPRMTHREGEGHGRSALMLTAPGEQHGLGIAMLAEFFRAGGWGVEEVVDADEAAGRLAAAEYGLVAISVAGASAALALAPFIASLRRASRRPRLVVMVGGAAINAEPSLLPLLGADATAPDAVTALQRAETLVGLMSQAA